MSGELGLPPQVQEQLMRLQQMQQTLQAVSIQRQQLELELNEIERAIEELEKAEDKSPVYKTTGSILIKVDRSRLLDELKERKELLNTRITVLSKQEERAKSKVKELQARLQERLRDMPR
ncbi:MAG: prefoldin subunit beta [Candidatus Bathyarchaeia archaeon]|nr:prefoldin subunit beta [Candidatus Bathyarchaeota archaeon]